MIHALCRALEALDQPPSAEAVADALWLASQMLLGAGRPDGGDADRTPAHSPPMPTLEPDRSLGSTNLSPSEPGTGPEWPAGQREVPAGRFCWKDSGPDGTALLLPAAHPLPNVLEISRALRPLKRSVPSKTRVVLDEEMTAERTARGGLLWLPVLRPVATPWLDMALVVDDGPSMAVWRDVVRKLRQLLERQGIARDLQVWRLDAADGSRVRLLSETGSEAATERLVDLTGRRLILLVSDCVSPAWWSGAVYGVLAAWSRRQPLSLLQVLPQRLWSQTALTLARPVTVRAHRVGTAGPVFEPVARPRRQPSPPFVPVAALQPASVGAWARLLAVDGAAGSALAIGGLGRQTPNRPFPVARIDDGASAAEQMVNRFQARASATAFELAGVFAAAPLVLPLMGLVRRNVLPDADHAHMAEVFNSGLLRRTEHTASGQVLYDFLPGVRDELLRFGSLSRHAKVQDIACGYVMSRFQLGHSFDTYLNVPEHLLGYADVERLQPFIKVTASVLRKFGGGRRTVAERVLRGETGPRLQVHEAPFVRSDELTELLWHLLSGSNVLLEGPRRAGKTRLLRHLGKALRDRKWRVIEADLSCADTEMDFLVRLGTPREALQGEDWAALAARLMQGFAEAGGPTAILADEFGLFVARQNDGHRKERFLEALRQLRASYPKIRWVFAASTDSHTLTGHRNIAASLNDLTFQPLRSLDAKMARMLLDHCCQLVFPPYRVDQDGFARLCRTIVFVTPYHLQLAATEIRGSLPPEGKGLWTATERDVVDGLARLLTPWPSRGFFNAYVDIKEIPLAPGIARKVMSGWLEENSGSYDARVLYERWLEQHGQPDSIGEAVKVWLDHYATAPPAATIYTKWLIAHGDRELVREGISRWLEVHDGHEAAEQVLQTWRNAGGDEASVMPRQALLANTPYRKQENIIRSERYAGDGMPMAANNASEFTKNLINNFKRNHDTQFSAPAIKDFLSKKKFVNHFVDPIFDRQILDFINDELPLELLEWLERHCTEWPAYRIYESWLRQGGRSHAIERFVVAWLGVHGHTAQAALLYHAWLYHEGKLDAIDAQLQDWLVLHNFLPEE